MLKIPEEILKGTYIEIAKSEVNDKHKNHSKRIGCCKCGRTNTTLYKLNNEERICMKCK